MPGVFSQSKSLSDIVLTVPGSTRWVRKSTHLGIPFERRFSIRIDSRRRVTGLRQTPNRSASHVLYWMRELDSHRARPSREARLNRRKRSEDSSRSDPVSDTISVFGLIHSPVNY